MRIPDARLSHHLVKLFRICAVLLIVVGSGVIQCCGQAAKDPAEVSEKDRLLYLVPPDGSQVAIVHFEDLECPPCAQAFPLIQRSRDLFKIKVVRHDFPLKGHAWSLDAAIMGRYLQATYSASLAESYRAEIFKTQASINSRDDLNTFSQRFFAGKGLTLPSTIDPKGVFKDLVLEDRSLGEKIGVSRTPTIWVVTKDKAIRVLDAAKLGDVVQSALPHR